MNVRQQAEMWGETHTDAEADSLTGNQRLHHLLVRQLLGPPRTLGIVPGGARSS